MLQLQDGLIQLHDLHHFKITVAPDMFAPGHVSIDHYINGDSIDMRFSFPTSDCKKTYQLIEKIENGINELLMNHAIALKPKYPIYEDVIEPQK